MECRTFGHGTAYYHQCRLPSKLAQVMIAREIWAVMVVAIAMHLLIHDCEYPYMAINRQQTEGSSSNKHAIEFSTFCDKLVD